MSEENKHMDDSFKKMSEDLNASYDNSFWQDAQANLENDALDEAFRNAADQSGTTAGIALASASLGDAFMDDAFQEAATEASATYSSAHWAALQATLPDLQMDDAFMDASKELKASYNPVYWGAANSALENEGLHYEYNSAYWNEAKTLLDNADKKSFFTKWTGAAALLLLISMLGIYGGSIGGDVISGQRMSNGLNDLNENRLAQLIENQSNENDALVQLNDDQMNVVDAIADDNENNLDINNALGHHSLVADNSDESNNTENNNATSDDANNTAVNPDEPNNANIQDRMPEDVNPDAIRPNPIVQINDGTNINNPLDRGMENNLANQNIGLNNGNQEPRPEQPEVNNSSEAGHYFINRLALPRSLIEFESKEMPNTLLATIEAPKTRNVHTFSILAGGGKGIGYGSESPIWTNRMYGGLAYNRNGHGKLRKFEFGANVLLNYSDHEDLRQEKTTAFYLPNTLKETRYVKVNVRQLYYLNLNLNTSYEFVAKHKLRFGIGLSRVLSAHSNVASNFRGDKESNDYVYLGSKFDIRNGNNGIPDGLNQLDLSLSLGYEFQINRRFSIQVTGKYGLFDRTNDVDFQNNNISADYQSVFDNERNVTIGLKYNLFRIVK
ncbi:MAG: hypothetical protein GQ574_06185 [Crocinitomix sp.]|nr:hypothetical protein [Crocinitomix sp.]